MHVHARNESAPVSAHNGPRPKANLDWMSVLDFNGSYYDIAVLIWHHLDVVSAVRLSKTCSAMAAGLTRIYKTRWKLESLLGNFVENATAFRRLLRSTGAVISGHAAADFVYGPAIDGVVHGVLKIYVVAAKAGVLSTHLDSCERGLERVGPGRSFHLQPSWKTRKLFDTASHPYGQPRRIHLRLVTSDVLLETIYSVSQTRCMNFITWDRAICLFPASSLAVTHGTPRCSQTIINEGSGRVSATGLPSESRLGDGHDAGNMQVDRRQTLATDGKAVFRRKAPDTWPELHRERSFGDSYSWLIPFESIFDGAEPPVPKITGRPHELCFFSLPGLRGQKIVGAQIRELSQATASTRRPNDTVMTYSTRPSRRFNLDMNLCAFALLEHIYSWTGRGSWPDMYNTSQRFFGYLVPSRMEHLCLHEAARTARSDLPACWPVSPPLEPTPVFVRCLMRHVSHNNLVPAHWRRYDDELRQWYRDFRSGERRLRQFGPPVEKQIFWCDAAEPDRLQAVQRRDRGAVCCKQWQEDYLRFLDVIRQVPPAGEGAKPSWGQLFLSD